VAGCAGQQLNHGLRGLIGLNIHYAVDILGSPDGQRETMGDTVYTWSTSRSVLVLDTTSATGMIGNTPVYGSISGSGGPVNGTTTPTSTIPMPMTFQCTIQITTDKSGAIKSYHLEGNQEACQSYARRFH
jgi:hypothetical protein